MAIPKEQIFTRASDGAIFVQRGVKHGKIQIGPATHEDEIKEAKKALKRK